ncbi:19248_t:CDS:2, partial [Racocetra fulgida]
MRQLKNHGRRSSSVISKKMDSAVVLFEDIKRKEKEIDEHDSFLCENDNITEHSSKKDKICHFEKIPLEIKIKIFKCLEIDEIVKHINLNWCQQINSVGIEYLVKGCQELECLKINGLSKISDQLMLNIALLPNLKNLSMESCPTLNDEHISTLLKYQPSPSPLTHIDLSNNQLLTDETLKELGNSCPELTHLEVHECTNFTDDGFIYIASKCTKLEVIDLEDCPCINDEVLQSFAAHLSDLKKICLSYCELITDDGVITLLQQCTKISRIDLDHCQLLTDAVLHNLSLILNDSKVNYMEVEIFDCRNISISAVRETVKKATDSGVHLKLKGYYAWQANNNTDSDDDDNGGRIGGSSWVRNNRLIRRLTGTHGSSLRSHLGATFRIRSTNRDNNRGGTRPNYT